MKPLIGMFVVVSSAALVACGMEQVEKNERAIGLLQKEVKKHTSNLSKIDSSGQGTARTMVEVQGTLKRLGESNRRLEEAAKSQTVAMEEFRTEGREELATQKQALETQLETTVDEMKTLVEKALGEAPQRVKKKIEDADKVLGDRIAGLDLRVGTMETAMPEEKEVAAADHLHGEIQTDVDGLKQWMGEVGEARAAAELPLGLSPHAAATLGLVAFLMAIAVFLLLLARTGKLFKLLRRQEKEMEDFAHAQRVQSRIAQQTTKLGGGADDEGAMKESLDAFKHLIESDDNRLQHLFHIGTSFEELGSYRIAKEWFDSCVKISSEFTNGWIEKGICLAMLGNYREADICIERALKQNPTHPRAWYNKACVSARLENEDEMFNAISKTVEVDPGAKGRFRKDKDFEKYWGRTEFTSRTS